MTQSSAAYSGMRRVRNPPNGWLVLAGLDVAAVACAQTPKLGIGSTVTPTTGERITTDIAEYGMCSRNYHHPAATLAKGRRSACCSGGLFITCPSDASARRIRLWTRPDCKSGAFFTVMPLYCRKPATKGRRLSCPLLKHRSHTSTAPW